MCRWSVRRLCKGQGLVVSLVYRLITLLIAGLGVFYYFGNRRELVEVIHEAEEEERNKRLFDCSSWGGS